MSGRKPSLNYTFIYLLNKLPLSFFGMPDAVLGTGDTVGSKNDTVLALKELTFWWGKTDNKDLKKKN